MYEEISDVDLIFIDSEHTYGQLKCELTLHGNKSKKNQCNRNKILCRKR